MNFDEQEIHDYLKGFGRQYVSAKEICRRAGGKKKFEKSPHWAIPILNAMVDKKILEVDSTAHYRIVPDDKGHKKKQWISPEIEKLLKEKGLDKDKEDRPEPAPIVLDIPETGGPTH